MRPTRDVHLAVAQHFYTCWLRMKLAASTRSVSPALAPAFNHQIGRAPMPNPEPNAPACRHCGARMKHVRIWLSCRKSRFSTALVVSTSKQSN